MLGSDIRFVDSFDVLREWFFASVRYAKSYDHDEVLEPKVWGFDMLSGE